MKALAIIQEKYLLLAQEQGLLDGMGDVAWGKDLTDCTSFLEQCRWISYKSKYAYNGSTEPVRWFGIKPPNKSQIEVMQQITPSYSDVMVIGPNLLYL